MTDKQLNKLMMDKLVLEHFIANGEIVAIIPALGEAVEALKADVALLQNTAETKATVTVGKTDIKLDAEEELIKALIVMSSALTVWATRNKRLDTKALAAVREYEIRGMRDEVLIRHGRVLLNEALSAGSDLAHFGMTPENIEKYRQSIFSFEKALLTRDSSVSTRILSRGELDVVFARISKLFADELDPLMELLKVSHPRFYDGYHSVRSVKALATRYRSSGKADPTANGNQASPAAGSSNTPANGNGAQSSNGGAPANSNNAQSSTGGASANGNGVQSSNGGAPVNGNNAQVPAEGAASGNGHAATPSAGASNTNGNGAPAAAVPNQPAGASPEPASSVPAPAADQPAAASFIG